MPTGITSSAINSGAINVTSFPGSEEGQTLVELTGTAEVVCELSSIRLRLTATASTQAKSTGSASTTRRAELTASTTCQAIISCNAYNNIALGVSATPSAIATASPRLVFRFSANTTAQSQSAENGSFVRAANGAIANAEAATAAIPGGSLVYRGATAVASAVGEVNALRKVPSYAEIVARCSASANVTSRYRIGAETDPSAIATANSERKIALNAASVCYAIGAASPLTKLNLQPSVQAAQAASNPVLAGSVLFFGAQTQANAASSATIGITYVLSAQTTAAAITQSAASDYATAMPAPSERLMVVQGSERRMEVTE
jgi:hypothetical protein